MSVKGTQQAALFARFGVPTPIRPDVVDEDGTAVVRVYAVPSREAAQAFVAAEHGPWDNPARYELREGVGWCVIVDLRAKIERRKDELAYRVSLGGWQRGGRP